MFILPRRTCTIRARLCDHYRLLWCSLYRAHKGPVHWTRGQCKDFTKDSLEVKQCLHTRCQKILRPSRVGVSGIAGSALGERAQHWLPCRQFAGACIGSRSSITGTKTGRGGHDIAAQCLQMGNPAVISPQCMAPYHCKNPGLSERDSPYHQLCGHNTRGHGPAHHLSMERTEPVLIRMNRTM